MIFQEFEIPSIHLCLPKLIPESCAMDNNEKDTGGIN
jgi:hypothetical protein